MPKGRRSAELLSLPGGPMTYDVILVRSDRSVTGNCDILTEAVGRVMVIPIKGLRGSSISTVAD